MAFPMKMTLAMREGLVARYVEGGLPAVADDLALHDVTPQYIRHQTHKLAKNKRDHRRRVTPERRHQLLQIYLHMGTEEARAACLESGVRAIYAEGVAHDMGLYRHQTRS